jgi:hypothetical protein
MELACLLLEHARDCFASNDEYMQVGDTQTPYLRPLIANPFPELFGIPYVDAP